MDSVETIINSVFKNEIQVKRIRKEIAHINTLPKNEFKISLRQGPTSLQIIVEIPPIQQINYDRPIQFLVHLDQRFPFVFPRVHLLSHVTKPTLADGRDYIEDIIHAPWSPSVLLHEIIKLFPKFIDTVRMNQSKRDDLLQLGRYYQEQEFELINYEDVERFECKEIINGTAHQRVIQLANSYVLDLEYTNKQLLVIGCHATKNLLKVEHYENRVLLVWKTEDDNQITQTIQVSNPQQFIDSIKAYKAGSSGKKIQEEDVTLQKFNGQSIDELLQRIEEQESAIDRELSKDALNQMMTLYQKAIEYYSAYSDDQYKAYVTKMQQLLTREDVQLLLIS